eukprot:TRINITY_DN8480_c0_g1_i1.p1 TRINITY_DN8480_c0_g1~~TRINITY_DN8480_c0_g1_i1.p1  ORF type:complete len:304 (+),score=52.06 TRINITY_DN8480_c0_g1_i1:101-1012(+)
MPIQLQTQQPLSVNFHIARSCNFDCKYCFHTSNNEAPLEMARISRALVRLEKIGMKKLNISGGEPLLYPALCSKILKFCKQIGVFTSIITNGSLLKEDWLKENAEYLDVLGVSCDSFDVGTCQKIGRRGGSGDHPSQVRRAAALTKKYGVAFKINTVVSAFNIDEDMIGNLESLSHGENGSLCRWKVFQVLHIEDENTGNYAISEAKYSEFLSRHRKSEFLNSIIKVEDNATMQNSYIIIDRDLQLLDCRDNSKRQVADVTDTKVDLLAKIKSTFDASAFNQRDGNFYLNSSMKDIEDFGMSF